MLQLVLSYFINVLYATSQPSLADFSKRQGLKSVYKFIIVLKIVYRSVNVRVQELMMAPHAKRPGFGSMGRPLKVKANHFLVECRLDKAYHFDCEIDFVRRPLADDPQGRPAPKLKGDKPPGPELKK